MLKLVDGKGTLPLAYFVFTNPKVVNVKIMWFKERKFLEKSFFLLDNIPSEQGTEEDRERMQLNLINQCDVMIITTLTYWARLSNCFAGKEILECTDKGPELFYLANNVDGHPFVLQAVEKVIEEEITIGEIKYSMKLKGEK